MEPTGGATASVLLIGVAILAALFLAAAARRGRLPALVAYIGLGLVIRVLDDRFGVLGETGATVVEFLARAGLIALLFRIGLESRVHQLLSQLRAASWVWVSNILASAALGYAAAHYLLGFDVVPSVVAATALTATSVGIPSEIWQEEGALETDEGAFFLDVAELDDISAIVLMAMLFSLLPDLRAGTVDVGTLLPLLGEFALKLALFGGICLVFALFFEARLTHFMLRLGAPEAPTVIGVAFVIAAIGALLGFSEAIGAFFAGLAYSRDPDRVNIDASIGPIHALLTPFFFIGVGAVLPPELLLVAVGPGLVLAVAAIVGKVGGTTLPSLRTFGTLGAVLIGVSMVPRAEITMIVLQRARTIGEWAVPDDLYSAMVLVSLVTSVATALVLPPLLRRRSA